MVSKESKGHASNFFREKEENLSIDLYTRIGLFVILCRKLEYTGNVFCFFSLPFFIDMQISYRRHEKEWMSGARNKYPNNATCLGAHPGPFRLYKIEHSVCAKLSDIVINSEFTPREYWSYWIIAESILRNVPNMTFSK